MTINDIWLLITAGLASVVSFIISIKTSERCSKLKQEVDQLQRYSFRHADAIESLEKRVKSLEEDIKKVKDEHQIHMTSISKMLTETDRKTDNISHSIEKRINKLYDIVQTDKENHISAVSDEDQVYRWIFPTEEPDHEKRLINGQWYTVIGVLKNSETKEIVTCEGFWNRYEFITTDNDKFDTVYAYIRKPESADVMEKVVQMALANKG